MESKEIKYFEWRDIQKEICKEMNIDVCPLKLLKIINNEYTHYK